MVRREVRNGNTLNKCQFPGFLFNELNIILAVEKQYGSHSTKEINC